MLLPLDVAGARLVLCGEPNRTARVARKYATAAELVQVADPAQLAKVGFSPALAVICADADGATDWRAALSEHLPGTVVTVDTEPAPGTTGTVYLIGAGPGDPGLMTVRAMEALAAADVVLIDHLAPTEDLAQWAPAAEVIDVGKLPGKHRVPQRDIDRLMIEHALAGRNVARLKGGDPYVFGRGSEELYVCEQAGLNIEVVSGVTSSIAVPARAKVPLTLRKSAHMFTVVSGHSELSDRELAQLAGFLKTGGTVSLLMGVRTLPATVQGLLRHGVRADMPVGTFEDVYRSGERVLFATLETAERVMADVRPPAVTVIGETVNAGANPHPDAVERRRALLERALS